MRPIWSKLKKLAGAAGAATLAACATVPATTAPAAAKGPALWEVSDEDTTIYLFGTIHVLPENAQWRTPAIEQAINASDELVIETLIGDDPGASAQSMMRLGVTAGLPPLAERIPEARRDELQKLVAGSGIPMAVLDRLETWAAGLMLTAVTFKQMGLNPEHGVERRLSSSYVENGRTISGLETVEQQLGYFDNLTEESQRRFLVSVLDDPAKARAQFAAMVKAWAAGDVEGIARTFDTELKGWPELYEALIRRRNTTWAQWIDDRLDRPGTLMVAVGAGHLAGSDSVQQMLAKRGIKARRIQ